MTTFQALSEHDPVGQSVHDIFAALTMLTTTQFSPGQENIREEWGKDSDNFRVELAKCAIGRFVSATGYRIDLNQIETRRDVLLLLGQTVPWHVARSYNEYKDLTALELRTTFGTDKDGVMVRGSGALAQFLIQAEFWKELKLHPRECHSPNRTNPIFVHALTTKKFNVWDWTRNN